MNRPLVSSYVLLSVCSKNCCKNELKDNNRDYRSWNIRFWKTDRKISQSLYSIFREFCFCDIICVFDLTFSQRHVTLERFLCGCWRIFLTLKWICQLVLLMIYKWLWCFSVVGIIEQIFEFSCGDSHRSVGSGSIRLCLYSIPSRSPDVRPLW